MKALNKIKREISRNSSKEKAIFLQRYFKTGKGEYAEGDVFLGLTVPQSRKIAKKYKDLELKEVQTLLKSKVHEERQIGLMILSMQTLNSNQKELEKLHFFYLKNLKYVNNWDLVDGSAENLVGKYLNGKNKKLLTILAKSKNIWERRIAIISTYAFIKKGHLSDTLRLSKILLNDKQDLIHKAVGWMLREAGKRDRGVLEKFLKENYSKIPRTTLRYAIEKFPENSRKNYIAGNFK